MRENIYGKLKIDQSFRQLVFPEDPQCLAQMETDILSGLWNAPLAVWNGYLIDGFSQYKICIEHQLPFSTENMEFSCREAAAAWICARQLKRSDIPEALRRFLIGIQYRSEAAAVKLLRDDKEWFKNGREPMCHQIAIRIGAENNITWETVRRFSSFARALELIRRKAPEAAEEIMYGKIQIAAKRLYRLSKLDEQSLQQELYRLRPAQRQRSPGGSQRSAGKPRDTVNRTGLTVSVKDMPAYDPDAEVIGLTLTIPSWSGSIDRVVRASDLCTVSACARGRLASVLRNLQEKISETLMAIEAVE